MLLRLVYTTWQEAVRAIVTQLQAFDQANTTAIDLKANIASPTLTGTPAAPTATAGTNTTQLATTAFVTTADNLKANIASPTFTGTPAAPTAAAATNTTQLATTAFVTTADDLKANLAGSASQSFAMLNGTVAGTLGVTGATTVTTLAASGAITSSAANPYHAFVGSAATQTWRMGDGIGSTNGNFVLYDYTASLKAIDVAKATGAVTIPGTLGVTGRITATAGAILGSFTVATRPAHAAGLEIYVSDGGAGAVFQGSNGTAWVNLG